MNWKIIGYWNDRELKSGPASNKRKDSGPIAVESEIAPWLCIMMQGVG